MGTQRFKGGRAGVASLRHRPEMIPGRQDIFLGRVGTAEGVVGAARTYSGAGLDDPGTVTGRTGSSGFVLPTVLREGKL